MSTKEVDLKFMANERIALLFLAVLAFCLGVHGYCEFYKSIKQPATFFDYAYSSINLFFMQFSAKGVLPWTLEAARWLAPASLSYTVIRAFFILASMRTQRFRLKRKKGHGIIFGLTSDSLQLALSMQNKGIYPVIVDDDEQNEYLSALARHNISYIIANSTNTSILESLNLAHAHYLLANTKSDTTNFEIVHQALLLDRTSRLNAVCKIEKLALIKALYNRPLFATNHLNMTTSIINPPKISARWLVSQYGPDTLLPNIRELSVIKICLISNSALVVAVILRLAEIGVYGVNTKLSLTLISTLAKESYAQLINNSILKELLELKITCVNEQDSVQIATLINDNHFDCLYICMTETDEALLAIQTLIDQSITFPIVITESDNIHTFNWLSNELKSFEFIHFAHTQQATFKFADVFSCAQDELAMAIHNQYLDEQKFAGVGASQNTSIIEWDKLPEVLKDANRNQADHIQIKCRYLTDHCAPSAQDVQALLTPYIIDELAIMEHKRWVAEKRLAGWKFTEGDKNPEKRLSPNLRPWAELSEEDKQKDRDAILHLPKLVELMAKLA